VTGVSRKPALFAGFLLLTVALITSAQDYVDVEAERRAEEAAQNGAVVTPVAPVATAPAASTYSGIRPYSGMTTVAQEPADVTVSRVTGDDSGSMVLRVQQLETDVRRLNGQLEEALEALRLLEAQTLERYVDIDRRLAAGNGAGKSTGSPAEAGSLGGALSETDGSQAMAQSSSTSPAVDAEAGEEAAYRAAYELVRLKRFDEAVAAFEGFLAEFPFGRYAPNAHYWMGELYLVITPPDPELARQNFKLLLDQYPADAKVPDALYKLGRVQFIKGNRQRSREYLDEVIREYPSHAAAQLARQFLLENF
jgi:tol-pal system protein YbgF